MFGITYQTWETICSMYFGLKNGQKKAYLQWFPFSKLSDAEQAYLSGEDFFSAFIKTGAFVLSPPAMLRTENYLQKGDGSFRDSSLISPVLYLVLQSIGMEVSQKYSAQRPSSISTYYAGNFVHYRPSYKQDYDDFFKEINSNIDQYQYFIKTDISSFYTNINLDRLIHQIDSVCNAESVEITQVQLQVYKELLGFCGAGKFPLVENSVASSYLATEVYLDPIDKQLYEYIEGKIKSFNGFKMIRYVDDLYILFSSDQPIGCLNKAYNEIRNEYSSILKEYGLSLNSQKCCMCSSVEINGELKKSLYDEYFNGERCEIPALFAGKLLDFINDLSAHLLCDYIAVNEYNEIINSHFSSPDIEFTPSEVYNYYVYENNSELQLKEVVAAIDLLLKHDLSFISLDPKRLTVMIMKTRSNDAIKAFLNHLFHRSRGGKWNSYDTTIAITYLIQSRFRHIDLLRIIKSNCPALFLFCECFCMHSFCFAFLELRLNKYANVISGDTKSYYLYFMYLIEKNRNNYMVSFAYYKNFFDRVTAHLAYLDSHEKRLKEPNYARFYQENEIKRFYSEVPASEAVITSAHKLRNANPLSHASAELLNYDSSSARLKKSIDELEVLIDAKLNAAISNP